MIDEDVDFAGVFRYSFMKTEASHTATEDATMTNLEGTVDRVRRRLALIHLAESATILLFLFLAAAAFLILADRIFYVGQAGFIVAGGVAVVAAAVWLAAERRRVNTLYAAGRIDRAFGLQERISSAMAVNDPSEPMLPALLEDARRRAEGVDPSYFRFRKPRCLALLPLPLVACVGLLFVPPMDLLGRQKIEEKRRVERADVKRQADHMQMKAQELLQRATSQKLPEAQKLAFVMQKLAEQLAKAPDTKKDAMLKMSKLEDEARQAQEKLEKSAKFGGMKEQQPGELSRKTDALGESKQEMKDLADAMKEGDLAKAAESMQKLEQKLKEGKLSDAEAKKLGEAMKELAGNLQQNDQMAQNLKQCAEQLCKSGTKAATQALKQMQLTQQQMQELAQQMQEMQNIDFARKVLDYERLCMSSCRPSQICPACGNPVCAGCGTYACVCCPVPMGPDGGPCCNCAGGGMMAGRSGSGAGSGQGNGQGTGSGTGGGQGTGQRPVGPPGNVTLQNTKVTPELAPGSVLSTQFLRGLPPQDPSSKAAYEKVMQAARKAAEDAIHREDIPPEYRDTVKSYFEDLEK